MINVTYSINDDVISLCIKGHADEVSKPETFNAVCGMVSVLGESCLWGCRRYSSGRIKRRASGHLEFTCKANDKTKAIVETCVEGIKQVALQFPQCFGGVKNGA